MTRTNFVITLTHKSTGTFGSLTKEKKKKTHKIRHTAGDQQTDKQVIFLIRQSINYFGTFECKCQYTLGKWMHCRIFFFFFEWMNFHLSGDELSRRPSANVLKHWLEDTSVEYDEDFEVIHSDKIEYYGLIRIARKKFQALFFMFDWFRQQSVTQSIAIDDRKSFLHSTHKPYNHPRMYIKTIDFFFIAKHNQIVK